MTPLTPCCSGGFLDSERTAFAGMLKPLLICFRTGSFINSPGQSSFFWFPELLHLREPGGTCDYNKGSKTKHREGREGILWGHQKFCFIPDQTDYKLMGSWQSLQDP